MVPLTVVKGESQGWAELLVARAWILWELKLETWLGEEKGLLIGDRCVKRENGSLSLRMGYLLQVSLLLPRSLRPGLRLCPAIHRSVCEFENVSMERTNLVELL